MLCLRVCVFVCVWGGGACLWLCVQNWIHSYVNRQCMCACIRRRDPYHGIMRSATVGYPQTVVIMAAVKRTDDEGRMDAHTLTYSTTHGPQSHSQLAAGKMTNCPFGTGMGI